MKKWFSLFLCCVFLFSFTAPVFAATDSLPYADSAFFEYGEYTLHYVRDKGGKHEVDFLVAKDDQPWMLVECKSGKTSLSKSLLTIQDALKAPHAFQVSFALPFEDVDCFALGRPAIVSARTLLSQLP